MVRRQEDREAATGICVGDREDPRSRSWAALIWEMITDDIRWSIVELKREEEAKGDSVAWDRENNHTPTEARNQVIRWVLEEPYWAAGTAGTTGKGNLSVIKPTGGHVRLVGNVDAIRVGTSFKEQTLGGTSSLGTKERMSQWGRQRRDGLLGLCRGDASVTIQRVGNGSASVS